MYSPKKIVKTSLLIRLCLGCSFILIAPIVVAIIICTQNINNLKYGLILIGISIPLAILTFYINYKRLKDLKKITEIEIQDINEDENRLD